MSKAGDCAVCGENDKGCCTFFPCKVHGKETIRKNTGTTQWRMAPDAINSHFVCAGCQRRHTTKRRELKLSGPILNYVPDGICVIAWVRSFIVRLSNKKIPLGPRFAKPPKYAPKNSIGELEMNFGDFKIEGD